MSEPIDPSNPTSTPFATTESTAQHADSSVAVGQSKWFNDPSIRSIVGVIALVLITVLTYSRTLTADFIWDDDYYVQNNPTLRNLDGLQRIWREPGATTQYYPLVHTAFWIEYHLWGLRPFGYHLINVLIQAGNALLVWVILRRLAVPGAWLAAAIFAIHPLQVETVAWISERKNLLSGLFYFLTLMVYLRYCGITPPSKPKRKLEPGENEPWYELPDDPTRLYALIIFLFACALLSKSVTATLPAIILLIIWWKRGRITLADITPLLPLFAMGIAMGLFTRFVEAKYVGATGAAFQLAPTPIGDALARCIVAGRAIWFYAYKLILPWPLIFNYPRWVISPSNIAEYLFPLSVIAIVIALWLARKRIGRGPLTAVGYFILTLGPALGFVNFLPMRYSFVADHFQYLAGIGLIVLIVAGLKRIFDRLIASEALNPLTPPNLAGLVIAIFATISIVHSATFDDLETLWKDTLRATDQKSWMATNNYGVLLLHKGTPQAWDAARAYFLKTLKLNPGHAEARYNLGKMADGEKHYEEALQYFRESMAQSPPYPLSEFEIVQELMKLGREDEARAAAKELVDHFPNNDQARGVYGMLLARAGDRRGAMEQYSTAVDVAPNSALAHFNYAGALMREGQAAEALQEYAKTIELDPSDPVYINSFGGAMLAVGNFEAAAKLFAKAIDVDPKFANAYFNLGLLEQKELKLEASEKDLAKANELSPKDERISEALARTRDWIANPSNRPTTRLTTSRPTSKAAAIPATSSTTPAGAPQ